MHGVKFNAALFNLDPQNDDDGFFDDDYARYIIRYATGEKLSKDANGKGSYDVKLPLSNCEDVYVYNKYFYPGNDGKGQYDLNSAPEVTPERKKTRGFFSPGTVVRDEQKRLLYQWKRDIRAHSQFNKRPFCQKPGACRRGH